MTDKELKLKLLKGLDIEYEGILLRHYKIGEIVENLGSDKYDYLISLTILDVKDVFKDSKIENIDNLKLYDLICISFEFNNWFVEFLNTFTYTEWEFGKFNDFVSYIVGKRIRITESKFDGLMELIRKMYVVSRGSKKSEVDINPIMATSKEAKELADFFLEPDDKTNEKNSKDIITLNGVINGLISKGVGYNYSNIWDLKMYQLMSLYYGVMKSDDYQNIMTSVYHGVWDTKKNPINFNSIHWSNEVNI